MNVYTNGCDWVIASSAEEALDLWCQATGEKRSDWSAGDFEMLPDDRLLAIFFDDGENQVIKTCGEWAAEHGRGVIASTEY
jgi:hypothetical protein